MNKKLSVLFILPSLGMGGAERQVVDLVNNLSETKFNIFLTTFQKKFNILENVNREKVTYIHCPREYKFDFSVTKKIAQVIDRENIDLVHWTNQISLLFGSLARLRAKKRVKFVGAIHTTINRNIIEDLFDRFLYTPMMIFSKAIIMVCNNQKSHWSRKYPFLSRKFITIHNGIDTKKFRDTLSSSDKERIQASLGIDKNDFTAAILAGLRIEKGHEYAFHALKILKDAGKKIKLLLIGDGERKAYLQSLAHSLSISDNIIWLGWKKDPRPFISICDIVLLPSVAIETFSIAILESLSMGKPVIATDIGGTSEMIINDKNGFLVEPKDVDALAEKMSIIIKNNDVRDTLQKNARESIIDKFSVAEMVKKTEELLTAVAHKYN
jgi:glycosyltransferase involved in cell wall biosynthesis